jgi:hypothetical protein
MAKDKPDQPNLRLVSDENLKPEEPRHTLVETASPARLLLSSSEYVRAARYLGIRMVSTALSQEVLVFQPKHRQTAISLHWLMRGMGYEAPNSNAGVLGVQLTTLGREVDVPVISFKGSGDMTDVTRAAAKMMEETNSALEDLGSPIRIPTSAQLEV